MKCVKPNLTGPEEDRIMKKYFRGLYRDRYLIILISPVVLYFLVFAYYPMYGVIIAFKEYRVALGIWGSPWIGSDHFIRFFQSIFFTRLITNTLLISLYSLLWGFLCLSNKKYSIGQRKSTALTQHLD